MSRSRSRSRTHGIRVGSRQRRAAFSRTSLGEPEQYPEGRVGLITHWAPGRFDNIQFEYGVFRPCTFTFDEPLSQFWIVSGSWNTNGGTLNSTAVGQSDIVKLDSP